MLGGTRLPHLVQDGTWEWDGVEWGEVGWSGVRLGEVGWVELVKDTYIPVAILAT